MSFFPEDPRNRVNRQQAIDTRGIVFSVDYINEDNPELMSYLKNSVVIDPADSTIQAEAFRDMIEVLVATIVPDTDKEEIKTFQLCNPDIVYVRPATIPGGMMSSVFSGTTQWNQPRQQSIPMNYLVLYYKGLSRYVILGISGDPHHLRMVTVAPANYGGFGGFGPQLNAGSHTQLFNAIVLAFMAKINGYNNNDNGWGR